MTCSPPRAAAAVTIDVDSLRCYREIHGLPARSDEDDPVYTEALPRFLDLMRDLDVRATLFVVGQDLERAAHGALLERAAKEGHEIASHSYSHDYALSQRSFAEICSDLWRADDAIAGVSGRRPAGFRAPGYNQSEALFDAIEALGYRYDSSFFPTPAYFAARAGALALYKVKGRPSRSLIGDVREFSAPRAPFVPAKGARHRPAKGSEASRPFVEIPMSVASRARLPWLGTTLALFPDGVGKALTRAALTGPGPCVLELHAIDFLGPDDVDDGSLVAAQGDLRVATSDKLRRIGGAVERMRAARSVVPLEDIARASHLVGSAG